MDPNRAPQDIVFWYLRDMPWQPLRESITVDVVVVGGGMAGLMAAQSFKQRGLSVALLEKTYCGAGATGKSSGFITPNSELSLSDLVKFYGNDSAKALWDFVTDGVAQIHKTIQDYSLPCDYREQDTLVVATTPHAVRSILQPEQDAWQALSYESTLYSQQELPQHLGSTAYYGGIRYGKTFGINGYAYCQALKKVLGSQGVQIYEETPVIELTASGVVTPCARVKAEHVVVCMDRFIPDLGKLKEEIYHVQTFLMLSSPLSDGAIRSLFPDAPFMVWDTNMIYNYYRLTADNRLMVGGAELLSTYAQQEKHNNDEQAKQLTAYIRSIFPQVKLELDYIWPGLLGVSKDLMPIAGPDAHMPHIYYIGAAAGLPWAAALGNYSAEHLLDGRRDLDRFFSPERSFLLGKWASLLLGKPFTFAVSNFMRVGSM